MKQKDLILLKRNLFSEPSHKKDLYTPLTLKYGFIFRDKEILRMGNTFLTGTSLEDESNSSRPVLEWSV